MGGRRLRCRLIGLSALVALALTGCGFLGDLATEDEPPEYGHPTAAAPTEPRPPEAQIVALAAIRDDRTTAGGPWDGGLTVAVHPPAAGLPRELGIAFGADCGRSDDDRTRYVAVDITFVNRGVSVASLAADVSLEGTGAGGVGVFIESSDPATRYCQDGDRTPVTDHFDVVPSTVDGRTFTAYLVAESTTDDVSPDFSRLVLELRDLRNTAYSAPELVTVGDWGLRGFAVGGACPDDPESVCAPLA